MRYLRFSLCQFVVMAFALMFVFATMSMPVIGGAQIIASGGGYLFHHKFRAGQISKFVVTVKSTNRAMPTPVVTIIPITVKVVSVANRAAKLSVTVEPMTRFGRVQGKPSTTEIEVEDRGPKGKDAIMTYMEYGDLYVPFVGTAIRVGQTFPINREGEWPVLGRVAIATNYTFSGFITVAGKKAARFTMAATKQARVESTITGTVLISMDDGSTLSVDQTSTIKMPSGSTVTQQLTVQRQ
jgi:hypothetical protein